jgi:DNA polymerase-3 subunit delta'
MSLPWHQSELHRILEKEVELSHALLIRGPAGIGKLAFAQALAKALVCEEPDRQGVACGRCTACNWVEQRSHPDVRLVEPESLAETVEEEGAEKKKASVQIGVDQVRALAEFVNLSSHRGRAKVIVVHPAEALNPSAANALLKSLEEPPPATYFLLVSHRWHQLLPTIKSRCRQVVLPLPDRKAARAWLAKEGVSNPELALAQAGGAPVSAARLNADYWEQRAAFIGAITSADFDPLRAAEQLRDFAVADAVKWLQQWSYDMVLSDCVGRARYNPDFMDAVTRAASRAAPVETLRFHRQMLSWQRVVNHPLNPRLFIEHLLLCYAALLRTTRRAQTA